MHKNTLCAMGADTLNKLCQNVKKFPFLMVWFTVRWRFETWIRLHFAKRFFYGPKLENWMIFSFTKYGWMLTKQSKLFQEVSDDMNKICKQIATIQRTPNESFGFVWINFSIFPWKFIKSKNWLFLRCIEYMCVVCNLDVCWKCYVVILET